MEMHEMDPSSHLMPGDAQRASTPLEPMDKSSMMASDMGAPSHLLSANDPDNPMNWPLHRRIYGSAVSWAFGFVV